MTISEKLYTLFAPLCDGRVYFDGTPKDGPEGIPYIVIEMVPGQEVYYVERELQNFSNHRVVVTGATKRPSTRDDLARQITYAMCHSSFPAVVPYGSWMGGYSDVHDEYYSQQHFGVTHNEPA